MILSAGLTPAWQQLLVFDSFTLGDVNRARQVHWCASGKVLNAARALFHLGASCKALTLAGGMAGEAMRQEFSQLGIAARWIESQTPTRVCTTIVDAPGHSCTELVPDSAEISPMERIAFLAAYSQEAANAEVVVLIGSLPVGTPADFYRDLMLRTTAKVILDARGIELLEALAVKPFLVKPNRYELEQTLGRALRSEKEMVGAIREMNERGAEWVVVTNGGKAVYAGSGVHFYRLQPPTCRVVNPIGCGDCMAAGIAWSIHRGQEPPEAIRFGLAAAASKVENLLPGFVKREQVEALAQSVEIIRL